MTSHITQFRRLFATLLAFSLIGAQTQQLAHAATDISDTPLAVRNQAQPNIMFMIDNSGSMSNIVVDDPYDVPSTTYIASCTGGNLIPAGSSVEIRIVGSEPRIRFSGNNYVLGTGTGQRCFATEGIYDAKLNADNGTSPSSYLGADYTGDYLNWYFNKSNTVPTWTSGQQLKPGTKARISVAQTSAVSVVNNLSNVRVGLSSYNGTTGGTLNVQIADATSAQKTTMVTKINALTPSGATPLAETLSDIGRYFATGYTGNLTLHPGQTNASTQSVANVFNNLTINNASGSSTLANPIQFYCQKSFVVLLTDGRPQQDRAISSYLRDYSGDCATAGLCDATSDSINIASTAPLTSPNTHKNGTKVGRSYETQGSDYLDDVASALFDLDLRPDLTAPTGFTKGKNNIVSYVIGFADNAVANDPLLADAAEKGGSTDPLSPSNASTLNAAFQTALEDILQRDGAAAAVAVANANVTSEDNNSYATSYNSGTWTGDLQNFDIDEGTGIVSTVPNWSAQPLLNSRTSADRYIASHDGDVGTGGAGIQFQPNSASTTTKLSIAQQTLLNTPSVSPVDGAAVVAYLRGDRSGETAGTYRSRTHLLGDLVNAEPVVVRVPNTSYTDAGYSAFKTAQVNRPIMVYQGANDGMLHAFRESTGEEEWAYIPNLILSNLNLRTRKTNFMHRFYVDGTPFTGDVDFSETAGVTGNPSPNWRTILAGGLNKGGRGYYALDITNPVLPDSDQEATLATKVLWEFPLSISNATDRATVTANMGYSYGNPIIVKTQNEGWVVLVTSGYNNGTDTGGDGEGYLYVLNAKTGDLIQSISTGVGSDSDPSGLSKISAYVENANTDNTTTFVYGGDLKGNVWRFDLTGAKNTWNVKKLATLVDGSGNFQPVTTAPELARININGSDRYLVYVGTGKYLGDTDLSGISGITANSHATQTQTIYGLLDDQSTSPLITSLRSNLQQQTITANVASSNDVNFPTEKGFYLDFPDTGERLFTDPILAAGALIFTTNTPTTTTCVPGGSSKLYFIDYENGGKLDNATLSVVNYSSSLSTRATVIKLPSGKIDTLIRQNCGDRPCTKTDEVPVTSSSSATRRINWREIINQ